MVNKAEELLFTQRRAELLRQREAHAAEAETVRQRVEKEHQSLERVLKTEHRKRHMQQFREEMYSLCEDERTLAQRQFRDLVLSPGGTQRLFSPQGSQHLSTLSSSLNARQGHGVGALLPASILDGPSGPERARMQQEQVRQNVMHLTADFDGNRNSHIEARTRQLQEKRERVFGDLGTRAAQVALENMEERIRWRFQHREALRRREEFEAGKVRAFERKEARLEQWRQRSDTAAGLRAELREIRAAHRQLTAREQRLRAAP